MKRLIPLVVLCAALCGCGKVIPADDEVAVVPLPERVAKGQGTFLLTASTEAVLLSGDDSLACVTGALDQVLEPVFGKGLRVRHADVPLDGALNISCDAAMPADGYRLEITPGRAEIVAGSAAGAFYAVQTLRQLIPAAAYGAANVRAVELPVVTIEDKPCLGYRGMMLDVCRHFFTVDEVKEALDIMALHKLNVFHWHLTDDQGWRIEIKKYPKLTEVGSVRSRTLIGRDPGGEYDENCKFDETPYGGYYTQDEIRDIVDYAAKRFITVIPEIEFPGHAVGALASYPWLGCTGEQYEVRQTWDIDDRVFCIGKETTFEFIEGVLEEVVGLFPSEYIHIGGDECPTVMWEKCPHCKARMKAEGLRRPRQLQNYATARVEKFLNARGRRLIGWDEILEGGLAPNATVMSWRGEKGGIEAAKQKHDVIMTPNTYLYFDYYQSTDTEHDPLAIGGYLPLERVYSFEPTAGIPEEYKKYVTGVQANLWTEYIPTFSQVEYMVLPRMDALAEVQWTNAPKDFKAFLPRLVRMTELYDRLGYNYAKHIFDIRASFTTDGDKGEIVVTLETEGSADIHYTLDGSEPTATSPKYEAPLRIKQNAEVKAVAVRPTGNSRIFSEKIDFNKATAKPVTLKVAPSRGYDFNGGPELTDGLSGNDNYKTGRWLGFQGKDLDAVIDLKEPTEFSKVSFNTNVVKGDWIMGAAGVTVKVSDDGQNFKEVASKVIPSLGKDDKDGLYPQEISFDPVKARYVEVIIKSDKLPTWHGGAGNPAFLFVDEINLQ